MVLIGSSLQNTRRINDINATLVGARNHVVFVEFTRGSVNYSRLDAVAHLWRIQFDCKVLSMGPHDISYQILCGLEVPAVDPLNRMIQQVFNLTI